MMWNNGVAFACLLVIAGFDQLASAARTRQQKREQRNPYLISPPGFGAGGEFRHAPKTLGDKEFTLRHIYHHGSHAYPNLHRYMDISPETELRITDDGGETYEEAPSSLRAKVATNNIQRLVNRKSSDIDQLLQHARIHGRPASLPPSAWTVDEVPSPNITDKGTVLTFAKMASNAYEPLINAGGWMDVKPGWNQSEKFGWEFDGLRGHIFADETNSTIVIALKGTTVALFDGAETTVKDKLNDNLFGSCCCGQGGQWGWHTVCDCMSSAYTCNSTCLVKNLHKKDNYYRSGLELYNNVTERYPDADIWLTGHSLGGVVSALLGLTFGSTAITYEAYPDALAASRLSLPVPPGYRIGSHQSRVNTGIFHIGHSADPIYMGSCNSASSWCTIGGYAFEGVCHTGQVCMYDTVNDKGWRVSAPTHKIHSVIKDVIMNYATGPTCEEDVECTDCYNWKFFESNGTETTTSSSPPSTTTTSRTRTRTETCKTPGWWGCLDETTTTTSGSTTSTSSSSTSTCKTPGWFGCKDPTTTTTKSKATTPTTAIATVTSGTSTSSITSSTATCETPGWFGCNDPTTTTSKTPKPSKTSAVSTASETSSCTSADWFGLICVDPSPTIASSISPSTTQQPAYWQRTCKARSWYGACRSWESIPVNPRGDL